MNRLFNTLFVMAFAAAMTITSAVAQQDKDTNGTAMSAKHSAGTTVADKTFVKKAAAGGLAEVELGQLATQKASSEDVKKFAKFHRHMRAQGIALAPSQFEAWFVSYAHTKGDIERTVKAIQAFRS